MFRAGIPKERFIIVIIAAAVVAMVAVWTSVALAATPGAVPGLTSTTHPDPSLWYQSVNPAFTWNAAQESGGTIAGYSFALDRNPNTVPIVSGGTNPLSFSPATTYTVGSSPAEDRVADLAGNGIEDIVVENSASNTVSVLMGNGDGTFKAAVGYSTGVNPWSLEIGDVNGDGKLDIVTCNETDSTVSVLLGHGDGTFQPAVQYSTGASTNPECMRLADLNGDGRLDIVTANASAASNNISVLLNQGSGTFGTPATFGTATHPTSIAVGDLNGDGKQDIVTANYASNNVSVLSGKGDGSFQTAVNYACGAEPETVVVADFDSDGHPDIATVNYSPSSLSILLNKGNGTFAGHVDYNTGSGPYSLAAADVNHDGVPDIVTTNHVANTVSVLLGNGNGTFASHVDYATGKGPFWVALGDFNSDGYGDVAVTNETDGTASVLLGSEYFRPATSALAASFASKADGTWYFHVRAVDSSGAGGATATIAVHIDTTAPTTSAAGLQATQNGAWTNTATVTLSPSDTGSGVATTYYTIGGGAQQVYHAPFAVSAAGSTTVTYWSVDAAGNVENTRTGYLNIDATAPVTTAGGLQATATTGWTSAKTPVTVTLAAADTGGSGLATTYYRLGSSGAFSTYGGSFTVSTEGSTEVDYYSTDAAGNVESTHAGYVNIDTTAPVTTATGADSAWHTTPVTLTFAALDGDGSGVVDTSYRVDAADDGVPWTNGTSVTIAAPQGGGNDGVHTVEYRSTDAAGNTEDYKTCLVNIDTTAPVTLDNAGTSWHAVPFMLELTAHDAAGTTTEYSLGDDSHWQTGTTVAFSTAWKRGGGSGPYTVYYRSTDQAGLAEQEKSVTVLIDTSRPITTDDAPSGPQASDVTVHLTATDTFSGVAQTWYQVDGGSWTQGTSVLVPAPAGHGDDGLHTIRYYSVDYAGNSEAAYRVCTVRIATP
jgi:FG-GAP-like repeat